MAPTARDSASAGAWNFIQLAFVLSGACALAYEVLWGRWLAAVLGSSSTAACVVLASYMGGQAAGAALFGRWSARMLHPLRAYVAVEVAIGSSELRIVFDDVYNFLHAEQTHYDIITSDPIHPFVRGGSTLYSADYFERAAQRLSRGGVFAQWLPLSNMGSGDIRMIVRNFTDVYPYARLYWNGAQDAILVGRNAPWNEPAIATESFARVADSLETTAIGSAEELSSLAFANHDTLVGWAGDGPRSTIDLPLLEFSAPRAMHVRTLDDNLATLLGWRKHWVPEVGGAPTQEVADAVRVLTELAPAQDPQETLRFLREQVRCPAQIRGCRPRLATQTLRHVLFREAYERGGQLVRRLEAGTVATERSRLDVARQLLEYARALATPSRAVERSAVELELERLSAISPS